MAISLEDRIAIGDLINRYNYSCDEADLDTFAALWTPDAVHLEGDADTPFIIDAHGAAQIRELNGKAMVEFPVKYGRHWTSSHTIWEEDGKTLGKCYVMYLSIFGEILITGTYLDEYVNRDGQWLFKSRIAHIDGTREQFETNMGRLIERVRENVPA